MTTTTKSDIYNLQPTGVKKEVTTTRGLKERRCAAGLTQAALAEAMKVSQQAVGKWERGECYPSAAQLPELAAALHCTIDELYQPPEESA